MFLQGGFEEGDWDELDFALEAVPIGGREEPVAGFTGGGRGILGGKENRRDLCVCVCRCVCFLYA